MYVCPIYVTYDIYGTYIDIYNLIEVAEGTEQIVFLKHTKRHVLSLTPTAPYIHRYISVYIGVISSFSNTPSDTYSPSLRPHPIYIGIYRCISVLYRLSQTHQATRTLSLYICTNKNHKYIHMYIHTTYNIYIYIYIYI